MKNFIERWKNRNCEKGEFKTLFNKKNNPDDESGLFNLSRKKIFIIRSRKFLLFNYKFCIQKQKSIVNVSFLFFSSKFLFSILLSCK